VPSLPRIRRSTRSRPGWDDVARTPQVAELAAGGLTWVNVVAPDLDTAQLLAERFGWHPLDVEDIVSKRQRPKVDDYEEERYLFAVLHFPVYDKAVQRLNAAELDVRRFARTMKVAAARRFEPELERQLGKTTHVFRRVIAGDNFQRRTADITKFFEQRMQCQLVDPIARRMRNDCHTARGADHIDRFGQRCPAMRHIARLALNHKALEHLAHIATDALFH